MTQIIKPESKTPKLAVILFHHIHDYKAKYPVWPEHRKIISDLLNCRTAHMGGHIERCDTCGAVRITYHSCRNRHCPKCQHLPRERRLKKQKDEILPASNFHVVFTLPHEVYTIILNNKKIMLNILFAAASKSLKTAWSPLPPKTERSKGQKRLPSRRWSLSACSFCTACPRVLSESGITVFWPIATAAKI